MHGPFLTGNQVYQTPQLALNIFVDFLNESSKTVTRQVEWLKVFYSNVKAAESFAFVPTSPAAYGPSDDYFYKKTTEAHALTEPEKKRLKTCTQTIRKVLNRIEQSVKALEIHVRLKAYEEDHFAEMDLLVKTIERNVSEFVENKQILFALIQKIYRRYQPFLALDPYLFIEMEFEKVWYGQKTLLDKWHYYLFENHMSDWPVLAVKKSILTDQKSILNIRKAQSSLEYPASGMISAIISGIETISRAKMDAVDANTYAAKQDCRHGNSVYQALINLCNNDLLVSYQYFVKHTQPIKQLLGYAQYTPQFTFKPSEQNIADVTYQDQFRNYIPPPVKVIPVSKPIDAADLKTLNAFVTFINHAAIQVQQLYRSVRNYQSETERFRADNRQGALQYSHQDFMIQESAFLLLMNSVSTIHPNLLNLLRKQVENLRNQLVEMDKTRIALIQYIEHNTYHKDNLEKSDLFLKDLNQLFSHFTHAGKRLHHDLRVVYESYPVKKPASIWQIPGNAMLVTLDIFRENIELEPKKISDNSKGIISLEILTSSYKSLILNHYQNLKGLKQLGKSNGLCPHALYEDFSNDARRLAESMGKSPDFSLGDLHTFFNNQLVYQYNKFTDLGDTFLLKTIYEPGFPAIGEN